MPTPRARPHYSPHIRMFAVSAHSRVRIAPAVIPRARARVVTRAGAAFEVPSAYKTVTPCGAGV